MKCNQRKEDLSAYIDGELNFITGWKIKRHLRVCSGCRDEVEKMQKMRRVSKILLTSHPQPNLYEKIEKKLPERETSPYEDSRVPSPMRRMWNLLPESGKIAIFATAALILFFTLVYPNLFSPSSVSIEHFEEEYLRSRESLSLAEGSPGLSLTLVSDGRG